MIVDPRFTSPIREREVSFMSTDPCPIYLVQREDGMLFGYWREELLLVDLNKNRDEKVKIFALDSSASKCVFVPITIEDVRDTLRQIKGIPS